MAEKVRLVDNDDGTYLTRGVPTLLRVSTVAIHGLREKDTGGTCSWSLVSVVAIVF